MQQFNQRKIPIFTIIGLLIIWTFSSIKIFSVASSPQTSNLRETQSIQELSSTFSTTKLGTIKEPNETLILSEVNGIIQTIKAHVGENVKGGQPIIQIQDNLNTHAWALELAKNTQESIQELYDKTQSDFSQQLQKAESLIADLQHQLQQTEQDLQTILTPPAWTRHSEERGEAIAEPNELVLNDEWRKESLLQNNSIETSDTSTNENTNNDILNETESLKQNLLKSLQTTEQDLEQAKLNYELLKTTQSTQLANLQQSLQSARQEYETAYTTYNKLSVRATLAGTISDIFAISGENIFAGSPLFSLIPNNQNPTIEVLLTFEEYLTALNTNEVSIGYLSSLSGESLSRQNCGMARSTGGVIARSPIANENGMYLLTIETSSSRGSPQDSPSSRGSPQDSPFSRGSPLLGEMSEGQRGWWDKGVNEGWSEKGVDGEMPEGQRGLEIRFPIPTNFPYLPKEIIEITNRPIPHEQTAGTSGYLYLLIDNEVQKFPVQLGHQRNNFIEIKTPLNAATPIITNRKSVL